MPSLRARLFSAAIRRFVRRRSWGGDPREVARSARRVFGAPLVVQWFATLGLEMRNIVSGDVRGEWLSPEKPSSAGAAIMYIHGGGFVACSSRTHRPISGALADKTQLPLFAVDYRLAPEDPYPAAVDDVVAAYGWLRGQGFETIAIAGDSAGGGLVMSLMLRLRESGSVMPVCGVCFSPWTDLTGSGRSVEKNAEVDAMFCPANMEQFAAAYLGDRPRDLSDASPVFANVVGLPPLLFQVGSTEILLSDSERIHDRVIAAGGASIIEVYDDVPHGWHMLHHFVPEAETALDRAAKFISQYISPADPAH